jgi:crotonobetainyl-CoA:carnitine CoA-transferase CaiB-like acyl-CoA transferase
MAGLLRGVKVIESAQLFTGDYAGQLLADEGADVVKLESPFRGDYLRDFLGQMKPPQRRTVTVTGNPVKVAGEHYRVALPAPALGQHTDEFLSDLGIDAGERAKLRAGGIIG